MVLARVALLCLVFVSTNAVPFPDEEGANILQTAQKSFAQHNLVQLEGSNSQDVDYPGCSLGVFWCTKLKEANVTSYYASRLAILPSADNTYDEWFLSGNPTCVAQGPKDHACEAPTVLLCAGGKTYGTSEAQSNALLLAIENGGVHPQCPGCTNGRSFAHSPTVCMVQKGNECRYDCDVGFVPNGVKMCQQNGTLTGGGCIVRTVDTDTNELTTPSPIPSPSPSPMPSVINATKEDVNHENWTSWQQRADYELTADFKQYVQESACLYLNDLENHFHDIHLASGLPIRTRLYDAARAAHCAWFHEEVVSTSEERKHLIPLRGDHGPWPRILSPNVVHVATPQGVLALNVNLQNGTGADLYAALAERMSTSPQSFTLYQPHSVHPVNQGDSLATYNLKLSDVLVFEAGQRYRTADIPNNTRLVFARGALRDADFSPIAP